MGVLRVSLELFEGRQRFKGIGTFDIGFGCGYLEFGVVVQFQKLPECRLCGADRKLRRKLRRLLLQHVGLRLGQVLLGNGTCFVELAVMLEFGLGQFNRGVCGTLVLGGGQ